MTTTDVRKRDGMMITTHMTYDEGEDLVTVTAAGAIHLVTDAVIVVDNIAMEEGGGSFHEHNEDEHWSLCQI